MTTNLDRLAVLALLATTWLPSPSEVDPDDRPNVLLCVADDWGWPHAGAYGDRVAQTPAFDRLAHEGQLFERAFVSSPSCTPSRNALLTGQHFWRLGSGANLHSMLSADVATFPLLLEDAGYHVGHWRKAFGPGRLDPDWGDRQPVGRRFPGLAEFLDARPDGAPFCFWLGSSDPHRPYEPGSGAAAGFDLEAIDLPGFWPDSSAVRGDMADYYYEVRRFDSDVGRALALLEERGELDDTIVIMTGDHGMPFPRCKTNLYDRGTRVPLAVRWGAHVEPGVRSRALVSLTDLCPTLLSAAGVPVPSLVTGRPLPLAGVDSAGFDEREVLAYGLERHTPAQAAPSMDGYPCRALRSDRWLYIRNLAPDRRPAGVPTGSTRGTDYSDCDDGPTKTWILANRDRDPESARSYELCFAKRPSQELYDLESDPDQVTNLAGDPAHAVRLRELSEQLDRELGTGGDPRYQSGDGARADVRRIENAAYFGKLKQEVLSPR